ncbi:hypothetical protein [Burkholderia cepacia]|uniref:hypothetical protein n=1 Tax=Burkholderia cepacia TaxID=292 RepID=UPI001CF5630D|nr:hypothetical protein [Burkholderia cepacia]MCA8026426.1 hypothetical protein [Burkholderia cepacia]
MTYNDEIDGLLEDWYDWQQSYRPKLGFGGADPACREYRAGWRESNDLADAADARARKAACEAIDACVSRLDLPCRVAIQTHMRNRFSGADVFSSMRVEDLDDHYQRAKRLLQPMFEAAGILDRACKPDKAVL